MLDAKPLDALEAIVRAGSFELAAQWLCITPSAVSQRIRQLEEQLGQTVLVRSQRRSLVVIRSLLWVRCIGWSQRTTGTGACGRKGVT